MKILKVSQQVKEVPWKLILDDFSGATATLLDDALLGKKYVKESKNLIQVQDGRWKVRWGTAYYGLEISGEAKILGAGEYANSSGVREIVAIGSTTGKAYKSVDGGAWTEITGATFDTSATFYFFKQINNYLMICNGSDPLTRYNGSVLTRYSTISAPTGLAGNRGAGLPDGTYHNYYKVTALNDVGETLGSAEIDVTTNKQRTVWNPTSNEYIDLSWTAVTGATKYQVYFSESSGEENLLANVKANSYKDDNSAVPNPFVVVPDADTTGAPAFSMISMSGSRIWGVAPNQYPYRVFFSGTGQYLGYFADAYGGGWVDLDKGGKETVQFVDHYRTGKGDSAATVFCKTPEGTGSIWQITLEPYPIGESVIIVPSPQKIVGSIGTDAPGAVVKAMDSMIFPNKRGVFTLGNKAQVTNVLSTEEISSNIRPSFRSLYLPRVGQMAGYWYDGKILLSAPEGDGGNDMTFLNDTERKNWNWKWTIGFKQFLEYTDGNGRTKFLGVQDGKAQLVEISENIMGDLGQPFKTSLITGLFPINEQDPTMFAKVDEVEITLGRPKGTIFVEVLGIEKKRGFSSLKTRMIGDTLQVNEFWTGDLGEITLKDEEDAPKTYSQAMVKKVFKIGKLLNSIQFHIYSDSADMDYTLIQIYARGTITPTSVPSTWKK